MTHGLEVVDDAQLLEALSARAENDQPLFVSCTRSASTRPATATAARFSDVGTPGVALR